MRGRGRRLQFLSPLQCREYRLFHAIEIVKHFVIGDTQNPETRFAQNAISMRVTRDFVVSGMRRAIDLDNERFVPTSEIGEIWPDRQLTDEFMAGEAAPP